MQSGRTPLIEMAGSPNLRMASLRSKQLRFIEEYLVDMNGTAAAVRAGYSAKCARSIATENLSKPALQAALRLRQAQEADRLQITRQTVIQRILEGIDMAREMQRPDVMIRGWTGIARLLGLCQPERNQVKLSAEIVSSMAGFEAMSDADLAALANVGKKAADI